ncbi:hypothetical protein [Burkholderia thailandensis]|uniref:hypothetical protein n=1 Tax=Burkholderia thailandensis TaxID=57975 RepID=UPI00107E67D9|nr:hypothetical protein [Burkholderia thailandensis]TGB34404.1 hypothetical protein C6946_07185 [Burkholderia thailandensis]
MSFLGNALGGVVGGIGSLIGGVVGAHGAQSAANTQAGASAAGIAEQQREFDKIRELLKPYVDAGTGALGGYANAQNGYAGALGQYGGTLSQLNNLTGANGIDAQQAAINGLKSNPLYTNSMNLGQQSILANASATGGLRGGNTIASLGYLPGQVLSNVMQSQIGNLGASLNGSSGLLAGYGNQISQYGNLINVGENAAAGTGQAAMQTGNNITNLTGQIGAAQAGGTLAGTNAITGGINGLASALGNAFGSPSGSGNYQFALPAYLNAAGIGGGSPAGLYGAGAGMF